MATITLKGSPIETVGFLPKVGTQAPDFTVTKTDLSEIKLKNYLGKKILINIFPSLDTETCATAMKRFNEIASQFQNILILCISADLPFAQNRFCTANHLENVQPVSVFRHTEFGKDYGVLIKDGPLAGLLSRAALVVDEHGKVIYTQQVQEITEEPDYAPIVKLL
jgi:thioredoxin-dependent peroxiredoxin